DGLTIEKIVSNAVELDEKSVTFNAKVIKVNQNIMGKNWVTLQDGTGKKPNNKLIATSQDEISPGEQVTVEGVLRNNVDIGAGYKYKVLLEQAKFTLIKKAP
ncbi:MAG: DNA-binding protein, partial [Candidatus Thiodiazotropha endolucinida]|nr:DNA-binding protein [Candidatus Thiodiazotropha endolucinida]